MTPTEMRATFWALKAELDAEFAKNEPMRAKMGGESDTKKLRDEIKLANAKQAEMQNELAGLVRALKGQTANG